MKTKSVVVTQRGGPQVLQVIESELPEPAAGQALIRVLAVGVGRTDINYRYGRSPLSPKVPFVPGYELVGVVEAVGSAVTRVQVGERVAALTGQGAYTERLNLGQEHLVPMPAGLAPDQAAIVVLNYVSAYQMLQRVAKVKAGDKVLLIGSSGGVGTALLQLGKRAGLKMYATASPAKFDVLTGLGAVPIDYHSQDVLEVIRRQEPGGLDFVFDGVGGKTGERALALLRRGGKLVGYAAPEGLGSLLLGLLKIAITNLLPNGKSVEFYGISTLYMRDKKPFMEDLALLFKMLAEGQIQPLIAARLPLLEARQANERLESGQVSGNIVLLAPELI